MPGSMLGSGISPSATKEEIFFFLNSLRAEGKLYQRGKLRCIRFRMREPLDELASRYGGSVCYSIKWKEWIWRPGVRGWWKLVKDLDEDFGLLNSVPQRLPLRDLADSIFDMLEKAVLSYSEIIELCQRIASKQHVWKALQLLEREGKILKEIGTKNKRRRFYKWKVNS